MFYGWWIVIIGCIQDAVKGGTYNTGFTLYFLPMLNELHLSRAATSLPFSLAKLESATGRPARRIPRRPLRPPGDAGPRHDRSPGWGSCCLSFTHSYLVFVLVFIGPVTTGLSGRLQPGHHGRGQSLVSPQARPRDVDRPDRAGHRRGRDLSPRRARRPELGVARGSVSGPASSFSLLLPLVGLMRGSPESMGLVPDGERGAVTPAVGVGAISAPPADDRTSSRPARRLRTPAFWLLAAFHGLRNVPYSGVTVHFVPLLVWKGLDEPKAAFIVGLTALGTVIVRPLTGWLGDRRSKQSDRRRRRPPRGHRPRRARIQQRGDLGDGTLRHPVLVRRRHQLGDVGAGRGLLRPRHFATIRGWISMLQSVASIPGAVFTGWIYDRTESYTYALLPFVVAYGLAGLILCRLPAPEPPARPAVRVAS